jgi:hypothetical protein
MTQIVDTHKGHDILLTKTLYFRVEFGLDDHVNKGTAAEIKDIIDDRVKAEVKKIKLDLPVLTDEGQEGTVTGLHMGRGTMLGKNLTAVGFNTYVYPVVDWVRDALLEEARLHQELALVDRRLKTVAIDISRGYGRVASHEYEMKIEDFKAEYAEQTALAERGPEASQP